MNINVFIDDKITEKHYKEAIAEYEKRLTKYCKVKLIQAKNIAEISKKIKAGSYSILFNPSGSLISSEELASKIDTLGISGTSDINIIYSEENLETEEHLSISNMTFGLGLTTVVLFEQIYRAYRIINNHAYHK